MTKDATDKTLQSVMLCLSLITSSFGGIFPLEHMMNPTTQASSLAWHQWLSIPSGKRRRNTKIRLARPFQSHSVDQLMQQRKMAKLVCY
jgi:hypothetical protein